LGTFIDIANFDVNFAAIVATMQSKGLMRRLKKAVTKHVNAKNHENIAKTLKDQQHNVIPPGKQCHLVIVCTVSMF
jgi:hypothetical protein